MTDIKPGEMYVRDWRGRLVPVDEKRVPPDVVICRRVVDYPEAHAPNGATVGTCAHCFEPIAFNPAKFPERPHICMQCGGIEPLPIEP